MPELETSLTQCPECGTVLPVPSDKLGQKVRCGKCQHVFVTQSQSPAEDDNPFAIPDAASHDEEHPQRPARRRNADEKKGISAGVIVGAALAGLVLLGGAAAAIYFAVKEPTKTADTKSKETPAPKSKEKEKPKPAEPAVGPDGKMLDATREKIKASTVYIRTHFPGNKMASGSGFLAAGPGLVITNSHVVGQTETKIEPLESLQIVFNSGLPDSKTYPAKLLKADRTLDLALLKVDMPLGPPPLDVIDAYRLKETQEVYIFGFPGGETLGSNISVNISTISSIRREDGITPWIQVAGGMTHGNSGGPVTDAAGRVIGVARAGIRGTQINMAIPGDIVHSFFNNAGDLIPKKADK